MASLLKKTLESLADAAASAVKTAAENRAGSGTSSSRGGGGSTSAGKTYGSSYDKKYMSDSDLSALSSARSAWKEASKAGDKAGMDAAHRDAEEIRARYGYSGGGDGSEYVQLLGYETGGGRKSGGSSGSFSYQSAPQYVNRYQDKIDELTAQILGREAFSYDPETDPTYQQYRESYTRGGQRAMQDTLAQLSARTGGLASSYAGSAAQQTYDNYMAALSDKVPELRQLAYSMYQDEGAQQRANLEMLMALEQGDYAKYQGLLSQYNTDRSFNYGVHRDGISDQRYDTEWNYQVGRDQLSDQRYTSETEYQQALAKAQTLAAAGDFSGYKALGYSDAEIANLKASYDAAQLLSQRSTGRSGGGSGSRGSGGSASSGSGSGGNKWSAVEDWVSLYGEDAAEDYIKEHYKEMGYSSQSAALSGWKNHLLESGGGDLTADMDSILSLGYGPISESRLAELEVAGEIESYEDGGKIKFRKTNRTSSSTGKLSTPGKISIPDIFSLYGGN